MPKLLPDSLSFEDIMLILLTTVVDCHIAPNSSLSCYKLYTHIFHVKLHSALPLWAKYIFLLH